MSFTLTSSYSSSETLYLSPSKKSHKSDHEPREIYNWILASRPHAACLVRDALEIPRNELEGYDFFWLGSVPCRGLILVGILVGVQVYDKRIIYTIDDGTGVIDCNHRCPPPKPADDELPPLPIPLAQVGAFLRVTGNLQPQYESRSIAVEKIVVCSSPNEELNHIRNVRLLHKTSYASKEPFVLPTFQCSSYPSTPTKSAVLLDTPSVRSYASSSISSSPIKLEIISRSPPRFRHPSRLHTHDLTENTFRIYLKHYMDNAPIIEESEYDSDQSIGPMPTTPTKRSRGDKTPRQRHSRHVVDATPRPRIPAPNFGAKTAPSTSTSILNKQPRMGFSFSYLRRVPELSLLASRVVETVGRRRLREEKKKMKEKGVMHPRTETATSIPPSKMSAKKRRLFQWAIIQLLHEGCIVIWDGPVRTLPDVSIQDSSRLWKSSTFGGDSTLFSSSFSTTSTLANTTDVVDDSGELSDPQPNEEAYISLSPEFLADFVEEAIKVLVDHYEKIGKPYAGATTPAILGVLKEDDRWRYVGEWSVEEALGFLKKEGRAWNISERRWDLTA